MLYYDRVDVSEGIDLNETDASRECDVCHYWYFLNYRFKFQPNACNRCHDLLIMPINLSDIAILNIKVFDYFFSIWIFFHKHSRFTGQQGKGEGIYLTHVYPFHPLYRHLDISQAFTAESSPLHIASSQTRIGNLWFPRDLTEKSGTL